MTVDEVLAMQEIGAQILDTRDPGEFAAAHLKGSVNIGLAASTPPGPERCWIAIIPS